MRQVRHHEGALATVAISRGYPYEIATSACALLAMTLRHKPVIANEVKQSQEALPSFPEIATAFLRKPRNDFLD